MLDRIVADRAQFQRLFDSPVNVRHLEALKEPQHLEALALFGPGRAGAATAEGATAREGDLPVNVSGGSLGVGQLFEASGGQRVAEVVAQLRGEAGPRQIKKAKTGLAQSWRGVPTATGAVVVLSRD